MRAAIRRGFWLKQTVMSGEFRQKLPRLGGIVEYGEGRRKEK